MSLYKTNSQARHLLELSDNTISLNLSCIPIKSLYFTFYTFMILLLDIIILVDLNFFQGEAIKHIKQVLDQCPGAGTYGTDCSTNINWPSTIFQKLIAEIRDDSRQSVSGVNGILIGGQSDIYSRASLLQTANCLNKWYLPNQWWWLQDFLMVGTEPKLEEDRGVDSFLIVNKCVRYIREL